MALTCEEPNTAGLDELAHCRTHTESLGTRVNEHDRVAGAREELGDEFHNMLRHGITCVVLILAREPLERITGSLAR